MQVINIDAQERTEYGKSSSKAIRKEGRIPVVIYSKDGVKHASVTNNDVKSIVYTPDFKLAEINVGGTIAKCTLQDIQFHPVTDNIVHMDFLELVDGHPVKVSVPVKFKGTSPGVKVGGKLMQSLRRVKIKCNPENIVNELFVDISNLELGSAVRVREIELPDGVTMMSEGSTPVANVEVPRALKSAASAAEKDGTTEEAAPAE